MTEILINGNFLCRNLTGIERFAFETLKELDCLLNGGDKPNVNFSILVPANARSIPSYKNISIITSEKEIHGFPKWDLIEFKKQCKKRNAIALGFSNTAPLGKMCGYEFIHDIYAADCPEDFSGLKDKLVRIYSLLNYGNIARNARHIFTVSNFSRNQIVSRYRCSESRISVIPNGWDHFKSIAEDDSIFDRFTKLEKGKFYFTLGSLSKRKNLVWIARHAEKNPEEIFAVSGKAISGLVPEELEVLKNLGNVVLLGYVKDEEVKSLMKNCRAFIFPSYYEGFGIPPLEALSVGTPIIVSRDASLGEIYGSCAHYIDSSNPDINLDDLLKEPVESPEPVLEKYTYKNAAAKLLEKILNCEADE